MVNCSESQSTAITELRVEPGRLTPNQFSVHQITVPAPFSPWKMDDKFYIKLTLSTYVYNGHLQFPVYSHILGLQSVMGCLPASFSSAMSFFAVAKAGRKANRKTAMEAKRSYVCGKHTTQKVLGNSDSCRVSW